MPDETPVTKQDLQSSLLEATDSIMNGIEAIFNNFQAQMNSNFDELKSGQADLQRQINDLKHDSPTRGEFEKLKTKVSQHHPIN